LSQCGHFADKERGSQLNHEFGWSYLMGGPLVYLYAHMLESTQSYGG